MSENKADTHGTALRLHIAANPQEVDALPWNALLARQEQPTPFMRHEYLAALHASGSATPKTGWSPHFALMWDGDELAAACPLYIKSHSYGEYVFDWSWANAYHEHGLAYYPKAVIAVPFTPVPGSRLMARDAVARQALVVAVRDWCKAQTLSSLHLLFGDDADFAASDRAGLMRREQVQFHWANQHPVTGAPFTNFDELLTSLTQEKRKKIRQERRKVSDAGVRFRWARGGDIAPSDWRFFYRCYERTYLEHGNPPYLSRAFFDAMARDMPEAWVMFVAELAGRPIATSLIAVGGGPTSAKGQFHHESAAYGRYWGALERVDNLHFEACYYQPLQWCIDQGVARFEGGAQGEHKMARALMPVTTHSAHWLAHPAFADAVQDFLQRESSGIARYMEHLRERTPLRRPDGA